MHGIAVKFDEKKDLTDIVRILGETCKPDGLYWLVLSIFGEMHTLEAASGISNLEQRIDRLEPFRWAEIEKFA
jgi:hypothetical protein